MKKFIKHKASLLAALSSVLLTVTSSMGVHAESYTYDLWNEPVPAPDAYEWDSSVRGKDMGVDTLAGMTDIFYKNSKLYIAMTGRIEVTDSDFNCLYSITEYETGEGKKKISSPTGLYVTDKGDIYVCEEAAGEIVRFDEKGNWKATYANPVITGLEGVKYQPTKVVVDDNGRIYVKAKSVYEGIIELSPEGEYSRFVGANEVSPSILDRFYRLIATDEQISRMSLWLPTDYSDIAIDKDGFLMATVKDNSSDSPVRKLNSGGKDIMAEYDQMASAMGDYEGMISISQLTNITTSEDGRFAVLDSTRSRVFVYSSDGLLVYTIGGSGKQNGSLNSPIDICFMDNKILVADLVSMTIEVFAPTEYGEMINEALRFQGDYDYESAAASWEKVYDINPGFLPANYGLGKQALRSGEYEKAMSFFKACGEEEEYSLAYSQIREKSLSRNFARILLGFILIIALLVALKKFLHKKNEDESFRNNKAVQFIKKVHYTAVKWPFYVLSQPFKAFDDVKYENAGSVKFGVVIFILYSWANLLRVKYAGFLVNYENTEKINVPLTLVSCLLPLILFMIGNWAIGTLIDGKGNFKQVFKVTAYALYPTVFFYVIGTILSRVIIYEEIMFVQFLFVFPLVMFAFYCFVGMIMIHQFSFTKNIGSILLTLVAMIILVFIIVLLVTLASSFINDMFTIWDEISLYYL